MTKEEAIERLKHTDACDSELCEAIDIAVKHLESFPAGNRKEKNGKVLDAVKENIEILEETDMDSLGKMNVHLLNITMVLCDISRSLAFIADEEAIENLKHTDARDSDLCEAEWIDIKERM